MGFFVDDVLCCDHLEMFSELEQFAFRAFFERFA
jgi:hypothetical protein